MEKLKNLKNNDDEIYSFYTKKVVLSWLEIFCNKIYFQKRNSYNNFLMLKTR